MDPSPDCLFVVFVERISKDLSFFFETARARNENPVRRELFGHLFSPGESYQVPENRGRPLLGGQPGEVAGPTQFSRAKVLGCWSVESQDGQNGGVHTPLFFGGEVSGQLPETSYVDRSDLLHQDPRV